MMKSIRYYIPNCITLANLIAGCLAIYQVLVNGDSNAAAWCIVAAGVFDLFDGLVARLLHAQSAIGADLDSLSDVVSFGVAPAFLLFSYLGRETPSIWAALPAFLIAAFSALRLAKFNNDTRQTSSFLGLPVPANALLWIGIVATLSLLQLSTALLLSIVYPLILISCIYLVADIPLLAFKIHFPLTEKKDRILLYIALVLLALGILFVSLLRWAGLLPFVVSYLISSAFYRLLWRSYNK